MPAERFPAEVMANAQRVLLLLPTGAVGDDRQLPLSRLSEDAVVDVVDPRGRAPDAPEGVSARWVTHAVHAPLFCRRAAASGNRYDLVVVDGSSKALHHLWVDVLPAASAVSDTVFLRVTGAFLADHGVDGVDGLTAALRRCTSQESLTTQTWRRSTGNGGTYWALVQTHHTLEVVGGGPLRPLAERAIHLRDLLDEACAPGCAKLVDRFRRSVLEREHLPLFRVDPTSRHGLFPQVAIERSDLAVAALPLDEYGSTEDMWEAARARTSKRGRTVREANKASAAGYTVRRFDSRAWAEGIQDVHLSKTTRGGKPLKDWYRQPRAGGDATPAARDWETAHACPRHHDEHWGVFGRDEDGEDVLAGYIHLLRYGNHAWYGRIMGHGDHLRHGVMYLLHFGLVEHQLSTPRHGLEHLIYGGYNSGPASGSLTDWKSKVLFEPAYPLYDEVGDWRVTGMPAAGTPS